VLILLEVVLVGSLLTGVRMAVLQIPASQHTGICIVCFTFCFKYFPIVPIKNPQGPGEKDPAGPVEIAVPGSPGGRITVILTGGKMVLALCIRN
jgi:hypothetical protein